MRSEPKKRLRRRYYLWVVKFTIYSRVLWQRRWQLSPELKTLTGKLVTKQLLRHAAIWRCRDFLALNAPDLSLSQPEADLLFKRLEMTYLGNLLDWDVKQAAYLYGWKNSCVELSINYLTKASMGLILPFNASYPFLSHLLENSMKCFNSQICCPCILLKKF